MRNRRIPQHFLDDLLGRTDITDVVGSRVKLKKSGRNYMGLCPFHNEKSPSFSVNAEKQFYHCFGCGAGGDAIQFIMEYEHLDFLAAVEELARAAGVEVPQENSPEQREQHKSQAKLYELLLKSAEHFYEQLKHHPQRDQAVSYLKQRGLSGQIARRFQMGFAPPGWKGLRDQLSKEFSQEQMILSGMLVESEQKSAYDRFRNRIMFPIRDNRGRVVAFGGRVLDDSKPKYLNSPETPVFHKGKELYGLYEAKKYSQNLKRLLIVEGYMDVVALSQFGITYAVATLGTSTSDQHLHRMFRLVKDLVFCFDGDNAGRTAAWRAAEIALPHLQDGHQIRFLFLPESEDPDTLVRKEGTEAFEQRIRNATPLMDFLFLKLKEDIDLNALDGKARYARLVLQYLKKLPAQSLIRNLSISRLADLTSLQEQTLLALPELEEPPAAAESRTSVAPEPEQPQQEQPPLAQDYSDADYPVDEEYYMPAPVEAQHNQRSHHTSLSIYGKIAANLIQRPALAADGLLQSTLSLAASDPEAELLRTIAGLLQKSPEQIHSSLMLTCDWLHQHQLRPQLAPVENSDYFWLQAHSSEEERQNWAAAELNKNLSHLRKKYPDEEYLHLKKRMTHHSSEVTEEERRRYNELLVQRKRRGQ